MARHKKLTSVEIILILAIIAVLVIWLFPRVLKILDTTVSSTLGAVVSYIRTNSGFTSSPIDFVPLETISNLNIFGI